MKIEIGSDGFRHRNFKEGKTSASKLVWLEPKLAPKLEAQSVQFLSPERHRNRSSVVPKFRSQNAWLLDSRRYRSWNFGTEVYVDSVPK